MGVCFTAEEDALLAHGWPRCVRLVDGHPHDKQPEKSAMAWLSAMDAKYFTDWPREVAHRALRVRPSVRFKKTTYPSQKVTRREEVALATSGPMKPAEIATAVAEAVATFDEHSYPFKVHDWIFIAEALLGTDETLSAIAKGFEDADTKLPRNSGTPAHTYFKTYVAGAAGFMLVRAKNRKAHVERLEVELVRFSEAAKKSPEWNWCVEHLDMALHGAPAVKRITAGFPVNLGLVEYAVGDPDHVRESAAKDPKGPMSVRLVALGGVEVMKGIAGRKYPAATLPAVMRDFGMVRSPETVELATSLFGKSAAKDAPARWLADHADYARPLVERAAKSGSSSAKLALGVLR